MTTYDVRVVSTQKKYSREFQTEKQFESGWKTVLQRAHGSIVICLCPGNGNRYLSVKHREGSDNYHLARYANTGPEHANDCRFHAHAPEQSGLQGYAAGVVEEADDNTLRIRLAHGLQVNDATPAESDVDAVPRTPGVKKPSIRLLGLLQLLWLEASLANWYPLMEGKRTPAKVAYWISKAAKRVRASRMTVYDVLLISAKKGSHEAKRNAEVVELARGQSRRLIAVSPLASFNAERRGLQQLSVSGPFGMPTMDIRAEVRRRVERSFADELAAWEAGHSIIAIAQLNLKKGRYADVLDLALMRVSDRMIPLDSGYEALIEAKLHAEGRAFFKPPRFEAEDEIFPDFWLLDMGRDIQFPLEVFGMDTEVYRTRRQRKIRWYNSEYGSAGWWHWNAFQDPQGKAISPFPERVNDYRDKDAAVIADEVPESVVDTD
ncbi:DUF1173 family protein [Pseudomonas aeruginosa]|uniref:DUF1173 family protein n=1 Tax=Pseudomonas aeruginosa TaxID=287 RepID=UPI0003BAFB5B|nr:DUF1173 family protein [Pseudomonas aeruginosa]ERZ01100.1 hypothetical protein Q022_02242 [Pseudomonas aeruginosa BWHPSA009]MCO1948131.1 DUF1173 domain-containing protein [Pseudomonas aeruginosa]